MWSQTSSWGPSFWQTSQCEKDFRRIQFFPLVFPMFTHPWHEVDSCVAHLHMQNAGTGAKHARSEIFQVSQTEIAHVLILGIFNGNSRLFPDPLMRELGEESSRRKHTTDKHPKIMVSLAVKITSCSVHVFFCSTECTKDPIQKWQEIQSSQCAFQFFATLERFAVEYFTMIFF